MISAFFWEKNQHFSGKNSTFPQNNSVRAVLDIFSSVFSFFKIKVTGIENVSLADYVSRNQLSDCSESAMNQENNNNVTICWRDVIVNLLERFFVWFLFVNFSYWFKFYVNILTGSGVMTIFFFEGLTRNLEIGNIIVWDFLNIWRLGKASNIKFARNISNEIILNASKFQSYSFYLVWVFTFKPTVG